MDNYYKETIHRNSKFKILMYRIIYGLNYIVNHKLLLIVALSIGTVEALIAIYIINLNLNISYDYFTNILFLKISIIPLFIIIDIGLIILSAMPIDAVLHTHKLQKIGLVNNAQENPILLHKSKNDGIVKYEYQSMGIPLSKFIDNKEFVEASLNISITDIYQGKNKTRIIIEARSGNEQLPDYIEWSDEYLQNNDAKIVLGKSIAGLKIVNLDVTPHIQCGGITGSGKTVLLECVLYQLYKHDVDIYLCDFKGFIDFPFKTQQKYKCLGTKEELNNTLGKLIDIMEERKTIFNGSECSKISEYNSKYPFNKCKRIILASDEIAFAFQKKGLTGEDKKLVEQIEAKMALIAQQGRFAGIHLWLSTQRGDADTIPPQVRSNLTVRICGRASDILSRLTIDSSLASQISEKQLGRFVDDREDFFQAFYFKE